MSTENELERAGSQPATVEPDSQPEEVQPDQGEPIEGLVDATPASEAVSESKKDDASEDSSASDEEASMLQAITKGLEEEGSAEEEEAKPAAKEEPKAEEKKPEEKPDQQGDADTEEDITKMPDDLKPKAQERFKNLVDRNKGLESQNQELQQQVQSFQDSFVEAGLDRDGFAKMMDYAKRANSGDYQGAIEVLKQEMRNLMIHSGQGEVPELDVLKDFPDLQGKVNDFELTMENALELAKNRMAENARVQRETENNAIQEQQENAQAQIQHYGQEVTKMELDWARDDIDWPAKQAIIYDKLPEIQRSYPPQQWPVVISQFYDLLSKQTTTPPIDTNKPLDSQSVQTGVKRLEDHDSMFAAINAGLGDS